MERVINEREREKEIDKYWLSKTTTNNNKKKKKKNNSVKSIKFPNSVGIVPVREF